MSISNVMSFRQTLQVEFTRKVARVEEEKITLSTVIFVTKLGHFHFCHFSNNQRCKTRVKVQIEDLERCTNIDLTSF